MFLSSLSVCIAVNCPSHLCSLLPHPSNISNYNDIIAILFSAHYPGGDDDTLEPLEHWTNGDGGIHTTAGQQYDILLIMLLS